MKKIKLLFAAFAAITGIGGAVATNVQASAAPSATHDWVNWSDETILVHQTTAQAQNFCTGNPMIICLKAKDNYNITTRGNYE